jgi:hypothetical protein
MENLSTILVRLIFQPQHSSSILLSSYHFIVSSAGPYQTTSSSISIKIENKNKNQPEKENTSQSFIFK